jgi:hypothetical protein
MGQMLFGATKAKQWVKPYYHKYLKRDPESAKSPSARDAK